jgi:hypothetical protein
VRGLVPIVSGLGLTFGTCARVEPVTMTVAVLAQSELCVVLRVFRVVVVAVHRDGFPTGGLTTGSIGCGALD